MAINNIIWELQQEVHDILGGHSDLSSNISDIFYAKPNNVNTPYILVQIDKVMNINCFGKTRYEIDIAIEIVCIERDNAKILEFMELIRYLLVKNNFTITHFYVLGIICSKNEVVYGKHQSISGKMKFTVIVEVI